MNKFIEQKIIELQNSKTATEITQNAKYFINILAENERLTKQLENTVVLPCKVGDVADNEDIRIVTPIATKPGYRKEKEVAREFGERAIKPISQVEQTASVREKNAENDYLKNYFQGYRIGCATAIIKIKEVAIEYGVEVEK